MLVGVGIGIGIDNRCSELGLGFGDSILSQNNHSNRMELPVLFEGSAMDYT
jgi:hypothetical protein